MYLVYLQLLKGKYFQTEVIMRRIAKAPMPYKVKDVAKCPPLFCAKSLLEKNAGVNQVHTYFMATEFECYPVTEQLSFWHP